MKSRKEIQESTGDESVIEGERSRERSTRMGNGEVEEMVVPKVVCLVKSVVEVFDRSRNHSTESERP